MILCMLMVACKKEATRWQTDWLVPIVEDTLSLNHLYNDSTLSLNASQIEINLTRELLNLGLSELIAILSIKFYDLKCIARICFREQSKNSPIRPFRHSTQKSAC